MLIQTPQSSNIAEPLITPLQSTFCALILNINDNVINKDIYKFYVFVIFFAKIITFTKIK